MPSPFAGLPFGSLLEQMMFGGGGWTRSLAFDPRTGEWVDVSDEVPEAPRESDPPDQEEAPQRTSPGPGPGRAPRRRARPRPAAPANPLASLLGGRDGRRGWRRRHLRCPAARRADPFEDVGGMDAVKQEVRDTVGLILEHPEEAERYGIEWNGILLHGPPGVGKTYFAQAIAGEYGLNFIHVSTGDLVSSLQGGSAQNIDKAFDKAATSASCS